MIEDEFDTLVDKTLFYVEKGINSNVKIDLENHDLSLYPVLIGNVKDVKIETEIRDKLVAPAIKNDKIRKINRKN